MRVRTDKLLTIMSRKPIIAANWKMNIGPAEAKAFLAAFKEENTCDIAVDKVIVPPFVTIPPPVPR